ncbi:ribonuclease H-like domain-containing protein [Tanacetum coccineum]
MEAYFNKIESLVTILTSLDSKVNEEDVVHYAIAGLPVKYNQVCGYMHYQQPFPNFKTVRSLLLTEEMRLKSTSLATTEDSSSSSPTVLLTQSGNNRRLSNPQVKSWKPCFNFAKGSCRYDSECRYMHDVNAKPNINSTPRTSNSNTTDEMLAKFLDKLGLLNNTSATVAPTSNLGHAIPHGFPAHSSSPPAVGQAQLTPSVAQPVIGPSAPPQQLGTSGQATVLPHAFTAGTLHDPTTGTWHMYSGASFHLNNSVTCLSELFNLCMYPSISVGDSHSILVTNTGHSILPTSTRSLHLNNVLITPHIVKNLIYVRQFVRDNNCTIEFDAFGFSVKDYTTRQVLLQCDSTGDLYPVTSPSQVPQVFLVSQHTWHQRLGHPGSEVLRHLVSSNLISCNKEKPLVLCHACQLGKHVRLPFVSSETVVDSSFDIIHSDVWTSPIPSLSEFKYYVLFLDHYSQFVWTFPLINKSDVLSKFVLFRNYVRTQFQCEIRSFQCDHGSEFDNYIPQPVIQPTPVTTHAPNIDDPAQHGSNTSTPSSNTYDSAPFPFPSPPHVLAQPASPGPLTSSAQTQSTPTHVTTTGSSTTHPFAATQPATAHSPIIIPDPPQNPNPTAVHSMVIRFRVGSNKPTQRINLHVSSVSPLPKSYSDAFCDSNWQTAMRDEYNALI